MKFAQKTKEVVLKNKKALIGALTIGVGIGVAVAVKKLMGSKLPVSQELVAEAFEEVTETVESL